MIIQVSNISVLAALLVATATTTWTSDSVASAVPVRQQVSNKTNEKKPIEQPTIDYETKWFTQQVDHFGWSNQDTWQQRYLVNARHWCGANCPILFYCGNEGDIEVFTNNTGWMWENAENLHAMLVFAEHRYYGKSFPYPVDYENVYRNPNLTALGYLSSEQALADYAKLIFSIKNNLYDAKLSPVITIGGSYGGMLAAWMRMKYPHLVAGALAGSAPILQFPGEYNCSRFYQIVTKDFENYSPNCSMSIARSWEILHSTANSKVGLAKLSSLFNTCKPLKKRQVNEDLTALLANIWTNMAMTDYANEATFLSKMPAYPIKHSCEHLKLDPISQDPLDLLVGIAKASQVYTNYTGHLECLDIDELLRDPMDVFWDFQSCTEMVMPICSDGVDDMFEPQGFDLANYEKSCNSRWGVKTQVDKVRTIYGDKNLSASSNIIFSTCSRDPWSAGCPQDSVESRSIHAIKIDGVCHHEDLRSSGPNDGEAVKHARQQELNIIMDWIKKHYEHSRRYAPNETLLWRRSDNQ